MFITIITISSAIPIQPIWNRHVIKYPPGDIIEGDIPHQMAKRDVSIDNIEKHDENAKGRTIYNDIIKGQVIYENMIDELDISDDDIEGSAIHENNDISHENIKEHNIVKRAPRRGSSQSAISLLTTPGDCSDNTGIFAICYLCGKVVESEEVLQGCCVGPGIVRDFCEDSLS